MFSVALIILGSLAVILKMYSQAAVGQVKKFLVVILGLVCVFGIVCPADAAKHVYSPIVEQGEIEIETTGVYDFDHRKDKNAVQEYKNAIGYGVTDNWFTELYGEFERGQDEDGDGNTKLSRVKFTNLEWENRYQLTEQGKYWLDAGIYFAWEIPLRQKNPGKVEGKILLEKSMQRFTNTANLILEKEVGGGSTEQTTAGIAWSSRYRICEHFQPGFEYWANFGQIRDRLSYPEQNHQLGPAFYGHLTPHIKYDVGYLFGVSRAAPSGELKWNFEYELRF